MNKNLDYICATNYIIKVLEESCSCQEEAKHAWILVYHLLKELLKEEVSA